MENPLENQNEAHLNSNSLEISTNETNSLNLGIYLKHKRTALGFTQSEVAEKLGYGSPQFISNIERGISSVPLKSLKILVDLYQIPAQEVLNILIEDKRKQWGHHLGLPQ